MRQHYLNWNLPNLNKVLRSLCADTLGFNQHWRLINFISINGDGSGGAVRFWSTSRIGAHYTCHRSTYWTGNCKGYYTDNVSFFKSDAKGDCQIVERKRATLPTLDLAIRCRIVQYAIRCDVNLEIDLGTSHACRDLLAPFHVNREWRAICARSLYDNNFALKIKNKDGEHTLSSFDALNRLLAARIKAMSNSFAHAFDSQLWPKSGQPSFGELATYHISLLYIVDESKGLEHVRFDAAKFIEATSLCNAVQIITITSESQSTGYNGHARSLTTTSIQLADIRHCVFQAWPQVDPDSNKACPEIWMDGYGRVKEVKEINEVVHARLPTNDNKTRKNHIASLEKVRIMRTGNKYTTRFAFPLNGSSYDVQPWLKRSVGLRSLARRRP